MAEGSVQLPWRVIVRSECVQIGTEIAFCEIGLYGLVVDVDCDIVLDARNALVYIFGNGGSWSHQDIHELVKRTSQTNTPKGSSEATF